MNEQQPKPTEKKWAFRHNPGKHGEQTIHNEEVVVWTDQPELPKPGTPAPAPLEEP
jgi:hypothetical protein